MDDRTLWQDHPRAVDDDHRGRRAELECSGLMGEGSIERPRLLSRLADTDSPVVTIIAGAGYGKTTLVRQWDRAEDRDFAWVELQPGDDDPVVFMRLLIDSLSRFMDLHDAAEAAREPRPRFAERVLPALLRSTSAHGRRFVLVIDDVELIGADVAALLSDVLARLPANSQTVLIGRSTPPELRTARREIEGSLKEFGATDLAFTVDEAATLFAQFAAAVDPRRIAELVELTMGWPIGLHLAVVSTRDGSAPDDAPNALADDRDLLVRYLDEELMSGLDPDDRAFLFDSSVLEWLDGDLCDQVLELDRSTERLERLTSRGRVLLVAGGSRRILRFHPVLRDYLLEGLRRRDPGREKGLRRRAIACYETLGQHRTAVDSAIASGDAELAAEVLFRHLPTITFSGENVLLAQWLEELRNQDQQHRSGLVPLTEAWLAFMTNRRADMEVCLSVADSLGYQGRLPDGSASMEIASAVLRMLAGVGGIPASLEAARLVHEAGPQGSPWWGISSGIEALTSHLVGLTDDVREPLRTAEFESRGIHASHANTCAHLGHAELQKGNTNAGLALVKDAVAELTEAALVDFPLIAMVFCVQAYADAVRGDHARSREASEHARSLLTQVIDVVDRAYIHAHLLLGDAALRRGDIDEAQSDLRAARERLPREPAAVILHEWTDRLQVGIQHATGRNALPQLTTAERRVLEQLPTHRSLAEIGEYLFVSRNTVKSHTVSIYRKLGVGTRSDAVRVAKELDLS